MFSATLQTDLLTRGVVYRLLSVCFFEPEEETKDILHNLTDQCGLHFPEFLDRARELLTAFGSTPAAVAERKVEYTGLFVTAIDRTVLPYGSIYLEDGRKMMGESTAAVQRFYGRFQLEVTAKEVADHIAIELEFMHYLSCAQQDEEEKRTALEEFSETLVIPWLRPFADAVAASGKSRFYALLTALTADFVSGH